MTEEKKSNSEGLEYFLFNDIVPNPYNPRELFDRGPLDILKESIKQVGILVPLLVYRKDDSKVIILDGERRWRCVRELIEEYPSKKDKWEKLPVNIVKKPTMIHNILTMFSIHNIREPWELMPTALKLDIIIKDLNENNDKKIAELTGLSQSNVRRCKILLTYDLDFQDMMLNANKKDRIKADFFIELYPILSLIEKNLPRVSKKYSRRKLIETLLNKYQKNIISNVLDFRQWGDVIRSIKKGTITIDECEDIFLDLLESEDSNLEKYISKTYSHAKQLDKVNKKIEILIFEINHLEIITIKDRDKTLELLHKLLNSLNTKIVELEKLE